jgi:hypothetical protein
MACKNMILVSFPRWELCHLWLRITDMEDKPQTVFLLKQLLPGI